MSTLDEARAALRLRQGAGARYDAPEAPAEALLLARRGTAYFSRKLNELSDAALSEPSARPGWSRRRVVAAAALEARAIAQAIAAAEGLESDEWAETGPAALDLAQTLPPRALRPLLAHAEIHLNVVWRDLSDTGWRGTLALADGPLPTRDSPLRHARTLWAGALALRNGARPRDLPEALRDALAQPTSQTRTDR